jgi:hypothetical protein
LDESVKGDDKRRATALNDTNTASSSIDQKMGGPDAMDVKKASTSQSMPAAAMPAIEKKMYAYEENGQRIVFDGTQLVWFADAVRSVRRYAEQVKVEWTVTPSPTYPLLTAQILREREKYNGNKPRKYYELIQEIVCQQQADKERMAAKLGQVAAVKNPVFTPVFLLINSIYFTIGLTDFFSSISQRYFVGAKEGQAEAD